MNDRIVEAADLPEREKVYLRKSNWFGWKVVHPWRNEDRTFNWFNFLTGGSWANLIMVGIVVLLIVFAMFEYVNNIQMFLDCFRVPGQLVECVQTFGDPNVYYIGN